MRGAALSLPPPPAKRFTKVCRKRHAAPVTAAAESSPLVVELRLRGLAVVRQGALRADGVGALENPVLPGREAAENLRVKILGAGESEARLHARERVGRERGALFDGDAYLVLPVQVVGREGDEARLFGLFGVEAALVFDNRIRALRLCEEARLKPRQPVRHRERARVQLAHRKLDL